MKIFVRREDNSPSRVLERDRRIAGRKLGIWHVHSRGQQSEHRGANAFIPTDETKRAYSNTKPVLLASQRDGNRKLSARLTRLRSAEHIS